MLDTDNPQDQDPTEPAGDAAAPAAPRKRAPRRRATSAPTNETPADTPADTPAAETPADAAAEAPAPRKRAPRSRARAAAPDTPPDSPPGVVPDTAPDASSQPATDIATNDATAPPARAPRKRAAKKAAAPVVVTPQAETPDPEVAAAPAPPATETSAPPAAKSTRKRAPRKAAAAPATTDEAGDDSAPAAPVAPTVLFQAPDATAPTRRRRRKADAPADAPAEPAATPADAGEPAPADGDLAVAEDAEDLTAEPEDVREAAAEQATGARRRRRRGRRGRGGARGGDADTDETQVAEADESTDSAAADAADTTTDGDQPATADDEDDTAGGTRRRRRRRRSGGGGSGDAADHDDPPNTVTHVRDRRGSEDDGVRGVKGSTRLEAKRQRRRDGRETTRRRTPVLTEAEFLARRESVNRVMAVRQSGERTQIAVLEDDLLVEHYVTRASATSYVGNVYLGRVQNVLPSMEAAFIDIGKGRNGVLYAGEVNWDAAGLEGKSRAIEQAMKSGDAVLVQVTKDPIGHKGARLTSQISLPGRFLVYVPGGGMTGISRRLPDTERHRLKAILKKIVPDEAGVIVRTAAEGASEEDLAHDVERLRAQWEAIQQKAKQTKAAPTLVHGEPDLAIRVVRDVFNEDVDSLIVQGDEAWETISQYVTDVAPDLSDRVTKYVGIGDLFHDLRVDEQLMKALDRKVWLPSGGSLVIDRTEAMTVIDVNTGKFVGSGGNLEQTVTRNNLEAAEEIVRQLRLRDVGGIVVIDFIDMVLESNRELVLRRLTECLGRDRTKHQVAEVTSLGLVQMTRKRVGEGLLEAFSEPCEVCHGRGVIIHSEPVDSTPQADAEEKPKARRKRGGKAAAVEEPAAPPASPQQRQAAVAAIAAIHKAAAGEEDEPGSDEQRTRVAELANDLVAAAMDERGPVATPPVDDEARADDAQTSPTMAAVEAVAGVETAVPADGASRGGRRRRRAASRPAGPPAVAS